MSYTIIEHRACFFKPTTTKHLIFFACFLYFFVNKNTNKNSLNILKIEL